MFELSGDYLYYFGYFVVALFVFVALALYFFQNRLLYIPVMPGVQFRRPQDNPRGYRDPSEQGMYFEDAYIITEDELVLHAWWIPKPDSQNAPTIIFF
jgi:hypothetical protein